MRYAASAAAVNLWRNDVQKVIVVHIDRSFPGSCFRARTQPSFDGKTWWEHIKVLAADNMEGRDTGSPGLKKAEAYVVDQLKAAGLQPAGVKGFYQPVKFESRQLVESESSAALVRDGKAEPLTLGEDAIFSTRVDLAPAVEAPLVFVGYGLSIPESNFDDLAGPRPQGQSRCPDHRLSLAD